MSASEIERIYYAIRDTRNWVDAQSNGSPPADGDALRLLLMARELLDRAEAATLAAVGLQRDSER